MNKLILLFVLALVLAASGFGATLFVAVNGSGSTCSSASPCSLSTGVGHVISGDTLLVENGTYTLSQLTLGTAGTTIRAENKWGAVLQASSGDTSTPFINIDASNVVFQDFEVIGQPGIQEGVKCNGSSQSNCKILGNKVHAFGVQNTCLSGAGIEVGSGVTTGAVVNGNYVYNVGPTRSAARCNQYHAIYLGGGSAVTAQNNILFEAWQGYAIHINSSGNVIGFVVTNNTVFNSGDTATASGGPFVLDCHASCNSNHFNNNIFYNTQGIGNCFREVQESGAFIGANLFSNNLLNSCGSNLFAGGNTDLNTVTAAPQFVNYTGDQNGNYHLASGSPAIGAGTSVGAPLTDFDNNTISRSGPWSIGVYAFAVSSAGPAPPSGLIATVN